MFGRSHILVDNLQSTAVNVHIVLSKLIFLGVFFCRINSQPTTDYLNIATFTKVRISFSELYTGSLSWMETVWWEML